MRKFIHAFSTAGFVILLSFSSSVLAKPECVFDSEYFNNTGLSEKEMVVHYEQSEDKSEVKIITKNNNLVSIKYWACDSLGLEAVLFFHPSLPGPEKIISKMLELANLVMPKLERVNLIERIKAIKNLEFGVPYEVAAGENVGEYFVLFDSVRGIGFVKIKYYMN